MSYENKQITCADCGAEFTFSADDQEYYASKGYSEPKRCPDCRAAKKHKEAAAMAMVQEADTEADPSIVLLVLLAELKQLFRLSQKVTDLFIALTATEKCSTKQIETQLI